MDEHEIIMTEVKEALNNMCNSICIRKGSTVAQTKVEKNATLSQQASYTDLETNELHVFSSPATIPHCLFMGSENKLPGWSRVDIITIAVRMCWIIKNKITIWKFETTMYVPYANMKYVTG